MGSDHDLEGIKQLPLNLPSGSELTGDSAYTDYLPEDMLQENGIRLLAARKANSKRPHDPCVEYLTASQRKTGGNRFFRYRKNDAQIYSCRYL